MLVFFLPTSPTPCESNSPNQGSRREPKEKKERPPKATQAAFEFMDDGKGAYRLPSPELLDPVPPTVKKISENRRRDTEAYGLRRNLAALSCYRRLRLPHAAPCRADV